MNQNKMKQVQQQITQLSGVHSMGVIGDPGCEGLGTYNMKVYAAALEACSGDDITLIAGDLVPAGTGHYYRTIRDMTRKPRYRRIQRLFRAEKLCTFNRAFCRYRAG